MSREQIRWWLGVMGFGVAILWIVTMGFAQNLPPTQTINTNAGVPCHALGGHGPVERCQAGWTYGCESSLQGAKILDVDGNRTSIQFQNTGTIPIVLVFGDTPAGNNGFVVQPGMPYLWSNLNQGNLPGRVNTAAVSVISNGNSTCTVLFTN